MNLPRHYSESAFRELADDIDRYADRGRTLTREEMAELAGWLRASTRATKDTTPMLGEER